jgi:putative DNA methylase
MAMDDEGIGRRIKPLKASDIDPSWPDVGQYVSVESGKPKWLEKLDEEVLARLIEEWFPTIPYERRLRFCKRPEECDEADLLADIWPEVNRHLGTNANSILELVQQLGIARFGHRPKVADTLRRRLYSVRGGADGLRCLCLRPKPHCLHVDLGRLQHHRRVGGEAR